MRTQTYDKFWQRLHKLAREKSFPLRVMFELTYRCNFYCKHCYIPIGYRRYGQLETKEVFGILDQLADIGCFYLGFTGGEPFMRRDILDILAYAKKKGFEIIIYTNGSLINEQIVKELKRLRPNKIDITIPGMSAEVFDNITGVRGSRDRVFGNIELLHSQGIHLDFKTCVLKQNEKEIEQIQEFSASLGALHRLDTMLLRRLDGSDEPYRYRGTITEKANMFNDKPKIIRDEKDICEIEEKISNSAKLTLFRCGVGVSQVAITPQGELKLCLMINEPKYKIALPKASYLRTKKTNKQKALSLKQAWLKLKEFVNCIEPDKNYRCNICKLQPYCKWCPAKSWLMNRSFTSCDPESRAWAEQTKLLIAS